MSHTITIRQATDQERAAIAAEARPSIASWGCVLLILGGGLFVLGHVGSWLGSFAGEKAAETGRYIGWGLAAVISVIGAVAYYRGERDLRRRAWADAVEQKVQVVFVSDSRVVDIEPVNDNAPILCFDIGDNRLLYLQGQWLMDPGIYGTDLADDDVDDKTVNGLPEPHAFPSSEFTITRWPQSGNVAGIRVTGTYLRPAQTLHLPKPDILLQSEVFQGQLENIGTILSELQR